MNSSGEFAKILRDVFAPDPKWADWYMREVFTDDDLRISVVDNRPAAVMLASPYSIDFHGSRLRCDYISCVATVPSQRGKGLMRALMRDTLERMHSEQVPFAALIPASRPLYFIYDHMGFATVFYVDEERYTSLHRFATEGYTAVEPRYELFRRLEDERRGAVIHDELRFRQAVTDMELSNGCVVAVSDGASSEAIVFAEIGHEIKIHDLLATDEKAAEAALGEVRSRGGEKPFIVAAPPSDRSTSLRAHGMIRIVSVGAVLSALAAAHPGLKMTVRVRDSFLPANNGFYVIRDGVCRSADSRPERIDLDVSVDTLAKILFSEPSIGELFDLPAARPFISLMLD